MAGRVKQRTVTFRRAEYDEWRHYMQKRKQLEDEQNGLFYEKAWLGLANVIEERLRKRAHTSLRYSWVKRYEYALAPEERELRIKELEEEGELRDGMLANAMTSLERLVEMERLAFSQEEFDETQEYII